LALNRIESLSSPVKQHYAMICIVSAKGILIFIVMALIRAIVTFGILTASVWPLSWFRNLLILALHDIAWAAASSGLSRLLIPCAKSEMEDSYY
jgi:hypothetical protein